jgi:hypothetical protein
VGQDDVRCERGEFNRVLANQFGIACAPARLDPHVAADGPSQLRQRLQKRSDPGKRFRIVRGRGQ